MIRTEERRAPAWRGRRAVLRARLGVGTLFAALALLPPGAALGAAPMGAVESITPDGYVKGWAYAPNVPAGSAEVRFYLDSPSGPLLGSVVANEPNATAKARGISGNRGFSFQLPLQDRDGRAHTVHAVAVDPAFDEAGLDMPTACTLSNGPGTEARPGSTDDAYSWDCWRKPGDVQVGDPSLRDFCATKGSGFEPFLKGPQKATQAAYQWVCRKPQDFPLEMNTACAKRFGTGITARAGNNDDAYTWGCFTTSTAPEKKLAKGPDLHGFCAQKVGPGYAPVLNGAQKAPQAAFKWACRKTGSPDQPIVMHTACQLSNGAFAQARAGDINDAYTWSCYSPAVSAGARVGDPDLEAACLDRHATATPFLDGPQKAPGAAQKWKCRASLNESPLEMATACTMKHGPGAQARAGDVNDAYTWSCWKRTTTDTKVKGPDLGGYCSQKVGAGYESVLTGPPHAPDAASLWRCRKPRASPATASLGSRSYTLGLPATQSEKIDYVSMHWDKGTKTRARGTFYPWPGRKVALQTPLANGHPSSSAATDNNPAVLAKIVQVLDAAHDWYVDTTGRTPAPGNLYQGRLTFTVIEPNCGAACGRIGTTGIELSRGVYTALYDSVKASLANPKLARPAFDQAVFYELGRNFWFFSPEIGYKDPIKTPDGERMNDGSLVTGYAIAMRFASMAAAGVDGAPFKSLPFTDLQKQVGALVEDYLAKPANTWQTTLSQEKGVAGSAYGGADLFASFVMRLAHAHKDRPFLKQLWRNVDSQKNATTTQEALDNFYVAASLAADTNLAPVFKHWRWPEPGADARAKLQRLKAADLTKYGPPTP